MSFKEMLHRLKQRAGHAKASTSKKTLCGTIPLLAMSAIPLALCFDLKPVYDAKEVLDQPKMVEMAVSEQQNITQDLSATTACENMGVQAGLATDADSRTCLLATVDGIKTALGAAYWLSSAGRYLETDSSDKEMKAAAARAVQLGEQGLTQYAELYRARDAKFKAYHKSIFIRTVSGYYPTQPQLERDAQLLTNGELLVFSPELFRRQQDRSVLVNKLAQ